MGTLDNLFAALSGMQQQPQAQPQQIPQLPWQNQQEQPQAFQQPQTSDTAGISNRIQQWLGAKPPQQGGSIQDILAQRFQPNASDTYSAIVKSAPIGSPIMLGGDIAAQRGAGMLELMGKLAQMQNTQIELSKLSEQTRHDYATEAQNPNAQPISTSPMTPSAGGGPMAGTSPMNNPGNLRPVGASTGFQQFKTPQAGMDAMRSDLTAKINGSPAMRGNPPTLRNIITAYAPPSENNTAAYIQNVSQATGINPDQPLQPQDVDRVMPAMVKQEGNGSFTPLFRGNEIMKDNLSQNYAYVQNPGGGVRAQQIPGTIEKGSNGEILSTDANGNVTQQIPQNPAMRAKFEQNLQKIAQKFDELKNTGGSVEEGGGLLSNAANQLASTHDWGFGIMPGGQTLTQGSKAQTIRDEIQGLIKQSVPLYMQAMGITPGMERAVAAQQMLMDAIGGAVGKTRQANLYNLSNLSSQAGTGDFARQFGQQQNPQQMQPQNAAFQDGQTATNPNTGQKITFRNGGWTNAQ